MSTQLRYVAFSLIALWATAPLTAPLLVMIPGLQGLDSVWRRHAGAALLVWAAGLLVILLGARSAARARA